MAIKKLVDDCVRQVGQVLYGKDSEIRLALCCIFSGGHLLIEDLPGMGKTSLSQALAKVLGLSYSRVQFTSDLLPADIVGVSIFDKEKTDFKFLPGPVFAQLLMADEINRATPKTQSALLEAMEEYQVTVDGISHPLPEPFFVIATQNPNSQQGTYPLPESQLDRFLMRISLGYPDKHAERKLLVGNSSVKTLPNLKTLVSSDQLKKIRNFVDKVNTSEALVDYVQRLVEYTRSHSDIDIGVSPRAALGLLDAAKIWALMEGRGHVVPEDVQQLVQPVWEHRIHIKSRIDTAVGISSDSIFQKMLREVDVF